MNGTPDFNQATQMCIDCANGIMQGNPDATAFQQACQADSGCIGFAGMLQMCPQG
jgi:hypothetical protein